MHFYRVANMTLLLLCFVICKQKRLCCWSASWLVVNKHLCSCSAFWTVSYTLCSNCCALTCVIIIIIVPIATHVFLPNQTKPVQYNTNNLHNIFFVPSTFIHQSTSEVQFSSVNKLYMCPWQPHWSQMFT